MRTQAVFTNLTCNQNCVYCNKRQTAEDPAFVRPAAVRARIDRVLRDGAREVLLTGGEPTLRKDLPDLIAHARAGGAERVVLETNATLVDDVLATALRDAGLSLARVNYAGVGDALDAVTRDPGGARTAERGIRALADSGVPMEVSIALIRPTLATAPRVIERLASMRDEMGESVGAMLRGVSIAVPVESPDASVLVSYPEAAACIVEMESIARRAGLPLRIRPDASIPPCVFPPKARVTHLFSMTRGVHRREGMRAVKACSQCHVADACLGLPESYLLRFGVPDMHPVGDDRTRRRLTIVSSVQDQMRREFVTPNRSLNDKFGSFQEDIIRVQFQCNQSCRFCFVSTHLPAMGDEAVRAAIGDAVRRDVKVTLSGGEPTLNPRLVEYVRLAASKSRFPVQVQSNAIRMDDASLVTALVEAGMREAFVSLHGSRAEISDAVTEAPGTFVRTIVGLDHLHAKDIELIINFVICERNMADIANMVRLVASRWPRALFNVSFVAPSSDVVPRDRALVPRYEEALPHVAEAVQEAARLGVRIGGFESMCGIPLCLVPASLEKYFSLDEVPPGFDRGEFVKTEACARCALGTKCYGLRSGYRALHGDGELRPVKTATP